MQKVNIVVLEFSTGQVDIYENVELENVQTEDVEQFLLQNHNLDEINFMFSTDMIKLNYR